MKKVLIAGSGLAGTMTAKFLRESGSALEIVLLGEEKVPYYPRPNLIEFVAGSLPLERLFAFPPAWYAGQRIDLRLSTPVASVMPEERKAEISGGIFESYDILVLAEGASSSVPPIKGAGRKGVFTLRTLDDAQAILQRIESHSRTAVIGGGLLGLEIARALRSRGAEVTVLEFFPYLLPRQLDPPGAAVLQGQIEKMGIRVLTGVTTEEILGDGEASGLRLKSGETLEAGTVIIAAGIRPNTALARSAGLAVERGVVVNDDMETSRPGIYAAGDGVQHAGRLYGIIPASFEQARTAAASILGRPRPYSGTVPSNTLKVAGLALTSIGMVNPEQAQKAEELRAGLSEKGIYKKIVLQDGRLIGAVWLGTKDGVTALSRAVAERKDVGARKHDLLAEGFDFSKL